MKFGGVIRNVTKIIKYILNTLTVYFGGKTTIVGICLTYRYKTNYSFLHRRLIKVLT